MRIRTVAIVYATAILMLACSGAEVTSTGNDAAADAAAVGDAPAGLLVSDARSRMSPRMAGVAAIYLDIDNRTGSDDRLEAAQVPADIAATVEIHETFEREDQNAMEDHGDDMEGHGGAMDEQTDDQAPMMGMRELPAIEIPADTRVRLEPGGLHLMLLDLTRDLSPGDTFDVTLIFEVAGEITTEVMVRDDL